MFWESFIKETSHFARVFHSAIGLLLIVPCAAMIHPSMECHRLDFIVPWLIATLILLAFYGFRANSNIGRQVPREKKLEALFRATFQIVSAAAVQLYAFLVMEENPLWSRCLLYLSYGFVMAPLGSEILEKSYMCKFPARFIEVYFVMAMVCLFVVVCAVFEGLQVTCILAVYFAFIACLLTDLYMIYFHPSEIHFLGDFLGKRVVCKDLNGNEYKGDFVSVEDDISTSRFMRLVLKNVEKETDGMFVPHADSVYVDEISSLQLADEAAILM